MRKLGIATAVAAFALSGSAMAEVEPTSVKAGLKLTETVTCDINDCDGQFTAKVTGAQTFPLSSSVSDQFTPDTRVSIDVIRFGQISVLFSEDPNYQTGDESLSINLTEIGMGGTEKVSLKMSWKNGQCKVAVKVQIQADGGIASAALATTINAALPPGNPRNTDSMTVLFENGMTVLEESTGYFAVSYTESAKVNALPDNGYSEKSTIVVKSKYQVGEPDIK